jgi:hypothetical protein
LTSVTSDPAGSTSPMKLPLLHEHEYKLQEVLVHGTCRNCAATLVWELDPAETCQSWVAACCGYEYVITVSQVMARVVHISDMQF